MKIFCTIQTDFTLHRSNKTNIYSKKCFKKIVNIIITFKNHKLKMSDTAILELKLIVS